LPSLLHFVQSLWSMRSIGGRTTTINMKKRWWWWLFSSFSPGIGNTQTRQPTRVDPFRCCGFRIMQVKMAVFSFSFDVFRSH
jgi:hypothetical protein